MRDHFPEKLNLGRVDSYGLGPDHGFEGRFIVQGPCDAKLQIISDNGHPDWEHVSISLTKHRRCPNWLEMCFVKDLFWDEEECVMQLHPPLSQYVKNNRYCLHLWKPRHAAIPQPPSLLVGFVGIGPHEAQLLINKMISDRKAALNNVEQLP